MTKLDYEIIVVVAWHTTSNDRSIYILPNIWKYPIHVPDESSGIETASNNPGWCLYITLKDTQHRSPTVSTVTNTTYGAHAHNNSWCQPLGSVKWKYSKVTVKWCNAFNNFSVKLTQPYTSHSPSWGTLEILLSGRPPKDIVGLIKLKYVNNISLL